MAKIGDYSDFNIRWRSHPKYDPKQIVQTDIIEVILQKLEMLLFTAPGDILGEDGFDFGANLEYYLWQTKISNNNLKQKIMDQVSEKIPELAVMGYDLSLDIYEGDYQDILQLNFTIQGYNVSFVFD